MRLNISRVTLPQSQTIYKKNHHTNTHYRTKYLLQYYTIEPISAISLIEILPEPKAAALPKLFFHHTHPPYCHSSLTPAKSSLPHLPNVPPIRVAEKGWLFWAQQRFSRLFIAPPIYRSHIKIVSVQYWSLICDLCEKQDNEEATPPLIFLMLETIMFWPMATDIYEYFNRYQIMRL